MQPQNDCSRIPNIREDLDDLVLRYFGSVLGYYGLGSGHGGGAGWGWKILGYQDQFNASTLAMRSSVQVFSKTFYSQEDWSSLLWGGSLAFPCARFAASPTLKGQKDALAYSTHERGNLTFLEKRKTAKRRTNPSLQVQVRALGVLLFNRGMFSIFLSE